MHSATPSKNLFSPNYRGIVDGKAVGFDVDGVETDELTLTPVKQTAIVEEPYTPTVSDSTDTTASSVSTDDKPDVSSSNKFANTNAVVISTSSSLNSPQIAIQTSTDSTKSNSSETSQQAADDDDDDDDVFNPYLFIANLPNHATVCIRSKICLPPNNKKTHFTLALDLDETLVHCSIEPISNPDHIFPVSFNEQLYQVYVRKRPFLDQFFESIHKKFEV